MNAPYCLCPDGFYDDGVSDECQPCGLTCSSCESAFICKLCSENRFGPIEGQCVCPLGSIDRQSAGIALCENCATSQPRIVLQDDLVTVSMDLGKDIDLSPFLDPFTSLQDNCGVLFDGEQLLTFGRTLPYCFVNESAPSQLLMILGDFATVLPTAVLTFNDNTMKNVDCKDSDTVSLGELRAPENPVSPLAQLFGPSNYTSVCSQLNFVLKNITQTGKRGLFNITWNILTEGNPVNNENVAAALEFANQENLLFLAIPDASL